MTYNLKRPDPWYRLIDPHVSLEDFILGMLNLGTPVETLLVGSFYDEGRLAQRDEDISWHHDGTYDAAIASAQGGIYVEHKSVDIIGFYCIKGLSGCETHVKDQDGSILRMVLRQGDVLVLDNKIVQHRRVGKVGDRVLFRMWISEGG